MNESGKSNLMYNWFECRLYCNWCVSRIEKKWNTYLKIESWLLHYLLINVHAFISIHYKFDIITNDDESVHLLEKSQKSGVCICHLNRQIMNIFGLTFHQMKPISDIDLWVFACVVFTIDMQIFTRHALST